MIAFLISHPDDLVWVRRNHGNNAHIISHGDYVSLMLDESPFIFFEDYDDPNILDDAINFLSFNWYRNNQGREISVDDGKIVAEAFASGVWINVASVCREYFALKKLCSKYRFIYISCNNSEHFLEIAKIFKNQVKIYEPGHNKGGLLSDVTDRVLDVPSISFSVKLLSFLQRPFVRLIKNKTISLGDWSSIYFAHSQKHWLIVNSKLPWKSAYLRKPSKESLIQAQKYVPLNFNSLFDSENLIQVLKRVNIQWDAALLKRLSTVMKERYDKYQNYFLQTVALYEDMLQNYSPTEVVISSEFFEPYEIARQLAQIRGIKSSWLVDGYPVVHISKKVYLNTRRPVAFDRVYAIGCQHLLRLLRNYSVELEIVTIHPPILDFHSKSSGKNKTFDVLIMTWIPNDLGINGRNGARPNTLFEALRVVKSVGFKRIAIKIKHYSEKEWLIPLLRNLNIESEVNILEGSFFQHVTHTHRVIGGVSSAIGETAYHGIPYYIYEPIANGYSDKQLKSANIIIEGGVARTPDELHALLKRPEGSVINNRELLFGTECPKLDWSWDKTRELYTNWAAKWADTSGIKKELQWCGFPLWWASHLVLKDTAVDFAWYQALYDRLRGGSSLPYEPLANNKVYIGLFKSMLKDLLKWWLLRFLASRPRSEKSFMNEGGRVWFHCLESNFINTREGFCDRMYEHTPLADRQHGFNSAYIVRLKFKKADFLHPGLLKQKIRGYSEMLKREVEVLDRYLYLSDIIGIYVSLVKNYFRFAKLAKAWRRQGIRVGHAEFSDILVSEMQKSFLSSFPWSLSYAAMFDRWLQAEGGAKNLVTYGETLAPMRPVYFVTQKQSPDHKWVSIQHATIYKNKMGFYHYHSEFNLAGTEDRRSISPMPDYYFVHGQQSADILANFYPVDRIRTIGCLKYDSLYRVYGQGHKPPPSLSSERMLLLAPSVGDEEIILRVLAGMQALPGWRVTLSKHPTVSQQWIEELIHRNGIVLKIEFDTSKSTSQLIETASLVVCSYSGIALESYFVGVPSVRVLNPQQPPMVEDEPGLAYVTTQQELLQIIHSLVDVGPSDVVTPELKATLNRYFYKFDGLASSRFWTELGKLPDLPCQPVVQV